jgi:hypothetical protein
MIVAVERRVGRYPHIILAPWRLLFPLPLASGTLLNSYFGDTTYWPCIPKRRRFPQASVLAIWGMLAVSYYLVLVKVITWVQE